MSYGYGGQQNPYDQRGGPGGNDYYDPVAGNGGGNPYAAAGGNSYNRNDYGSSSVEMEPLTQNFGSFNSGNPNSILNEIADINKGIETIERNLQQLQTLQQRSLDDIDTSSSNNTKRQLDALTSQTMAEYRTLTDRVRTIKSNPESQSRFAAQVKRVDARLKDAMHGYRQVESTFRQRTEEQVARQYRIVRPDASEEEVRAAVEDQSGGQIFQQALMQSNRRGQAQAVLNAVQDRHAQLEKIQQQLEELAQMFQDLDTLVVQQEAAVVNIETKATEVVDNVDKGNMEIGVAVETARSTRRKKWMCLGISIIIIAIIAIVVAVVVMQNQPNRDTQAP
ncbi:hypothetical protein DL764_008454 [Monosporascus ibericus]|uniref:t-SNARE coiled-coil homology domain-containing protein n=1 Tax=Monosporascus ibericus TaxID=155417 RepID=A0A4Q4T0V2_9PEZI|nr:hypothetical protein DL764_008454 [Monosporascus ibericus]